MKHVANASEARSERSERRWVARLCLAGTQGFACLVALGAASCAMTSAGVAPKQEKLAATSAVKSAEEIIQPVRPAAPADSHLAGAKADIRRGETALADGEYEVARLYFERATEKANTAIVQARAEEAEDKLVRGGRS